jgi:hypothetical protein
MVANGQVTSVPLRRFASCFLSTRVLEAIWIVITLAVGLSIEHLSDSPSVGQWRYWTTSSLAYAGIVVLAWYYLGFGYIVVSSLVSFIAWRFWKGLSGRKYGALNLLVFCVHSTAVILIVFHGHLSPAIWGVWMATVLYNATAPYMVWRHSFLHSTTRLRG